jgi:hypothetical protein
MKYKTAVRLALKILGVFLIAQAIPYLFNMVVYVLYSLWSTGGPAVEWYLGSGLGSVVQVLIGLYLFFGGKWIVDRVVPSNRPYCHECAYELTGLAQEGVCPECGAPYRRQQTAQPRDVA